MQELASLTIWTESILGELFALLCFVVLVYICLLLQLMSTMGERARILELAFSSLLPVLAYLCLVFNLEAFDVFAHLFFA